MASEVREVGLDESVEVELWGPIDKDSIEVKSNYDTPMEARLIKGSWPLQKKLLISPRDLLYPREKYRLEIVVSNFFGVKNSKTIYLTTKEVPKVTLANNFSDKTQISSKTKFEFNVDGKLDKKYLEFQSEPTFDYIQEANGDKVTISPKNKLKQGQTYSLSFSLLSQTLGDQVLFSDTVSVIPALEIVSSNPANGAETVLKQSTLEFVFNKPVTQEGFVEKIKIEPLVEYSLSWKDPQTLVITPNTALKTATKYAITFEDSVSGTDGSVLTESQIITFKTAGKVTVASFSPTGLNASTGSVLSVTFNQPVDQASAQANFSLSPSVDGSFSWSGTTMSYRTSGLALLTSYSITVRKGVKSIGGEDSTDSFSSSFTTTSERSRTIGYSVRGRSINATYFGTGSKKILLVGTLHGNEANTGNMLNSFIAYLRGNQQSIGSDRTFIVVPFANPDGSAANFRFNMNNVDLNRNFGTPDWQALTYWQNRSYPSGGGSGPFSEPESRALRDLILSDNVTHIITYHSNANMVLGDGIATAFGDWYASQTGYNRINGNGEEQDVSALGYIITGTLEEWSSLLGKVTLVVEFISQTANEYSRNFPALKGLLTYPLN